MSLGATVARLILLRRYASNDGNDPVVVIEERITYSYWIIIEMMTVIICANLPTMPALVHATKRTVSEKMTLPSQYYNSTSSSALPSSPPRFHHLHPYALPLYGGNTSSHAFSTNTKSSHRSSTCSKRRWVQLFGHSPNPQQQNSSYPATVATATIATTATTATAPTASSPIREKVRHSRETLVSLGRGADVKDYSSKSIVTASPAREIETAASGGRDSSSVSDANSRTFYISRTTSAEDRPSVESSGANALITGAATTTITATAAAAAAAAAAGGGSGTDEGDIRDGSNGNDTYMINDDSSSSNTANFDSGAPTITAPSPVSSSTASASASASASSTLASAPTSNIGASRDMGTGASNNNSNSNNASNSNNHSNDNNDLITAPAPAPASASTPATAITPPPSNQNSTTVIYRTDEFAVERSAV